MPHPAKLVVAIGLAAAATLAAADINVGVTVSATGPAASLGIPEKNTIALMPQTIGGQKVNYIVLDDASDTTTAVANARKLVTESKVDILLGSTTTPNSLAMIDVASESQTPMISMAASARCTSVATSSSVVRPARPIETVTAVARLGGDNAAICCRIRSAV